MAGLSPAEALAAGTRVAAEMLGLVGEVGTIEVGASADLLVVQNNPLLNLEEIRGLLYVIARGEVRTPEAWMRD